MNPQILLGIAITLLLSSGCVSLVENPGNQDATTGPSSAAGSSTAQGAAGSSASASTAAGSTASPSAPSGMTGAQTGTTTKTVACGSKFCATRTLWVEGTIGLASLPVDLTSFNGAITAQGTAGNAWNLTVVLGATGDSSQAARANLDNIAFTWSHEAAGAHHLRAEAQRKLPLSNNGESASLSLRMPSVVVLDLTGSTTNGDASARDLRATDLGLTTSNGALGVHDVTADAVVLRSTNGMATIDGLQAGLIDVQTTNGIIEAIASAKDYRFESSNGNLDLELRPTAAGSLSAVTTNGMISLAVVEDARHGYDLSASTTNGMVTLALEDGQSGGTTTSKTFKTTNYSAREIRTQATIRSTNSMVDVSNL